MVVNDPLYGEIVIDDPFIQSLISTRPFRRLKEINQYGGVNFIFKNKFQVSRFDHSIGVWYILKRLGANREVQVAGLLHDIGHTAFSHMIDQALESASENFHENEYKKYLDGFDEVESLLEVEGIELKPVDTYPQIKVSLPDVGADRLDYALRDYYAATGVKDELPSKIIDRVKLVNDQIVFTSKDIAQKFARRGLVAMWYVIYDPKVAVVYQSLIQMLKVGIQKGWLKDKDMFKSDSELLQLLKEYRDEFPEIYLDIFEKEYVVKDATQEDADFKHVKLKARYFDPRVLIDENGSNEKDLPRVSELSEEFKEVLDNMTQKFEERKKGKYLKVQFKDY